MIWKDEFYEVSAGPTLIKKRNWRITMQRKHITELVVLITGISSTQATVLWMYKIYSNTENTNTQNSNGANFRGVCYNCCKHMIIFLFNLFEMLMACDVSQILYASLKRALFNKMCLCRVALLVQLIWSALVPLYVRIYVVVLRHYIPNAEGLV